jgi:hypothetical protein
MHSEKHYVKQSVSSLQVPPMLPTHTQHNQQTQHKTEPGASQVRINSLNQIVTLTKIQTNKYRGEKEYLDSNTLMMRGIGYVVKLNIKRREKKNR